MPFVTDSVADVFDVSSNGTVVGTEGYYAGLTHKFGVAQEPALYRLQDLSVAFHSITDNSLFIGGGASDFDFNTRGVVYQRTADGVYVLMHDQFFTPDGDSLLRLDVAESSIGVLGVGAYAVESGERRSGLWKLDGTYLADAGLGYVAGAKSVGDFMFVATEAGNVTAIDLITFQTQSFSGNALFGTNVEFMPGSVFATEAGHLGLIGRNPVTGFLTVKTFEVPQNTAPVVSAWDGTTSFVENSLPVVLDANVSVVDADSSDFAGGTVTVFFAANGTAADRLSVRHVGNSAGQIGVSGNNISFGGVLIGTKSGGTNGSTPLVVTLNAAANSSAVTALLQAISFQNVSESPSTAARRVQVVVADGDGGTSAAVSKRVTVTAVNDWPVIAIEPGSPVIRWNAVPEAVSYDVFVQELKTSGRVSTTYSTAATQWDIPAALQGSALRIWARGVLADGSKGLWSPTAVEFTVGPVPVVHTIPSPSLSTTPTLDWAVPVGTTQTEIWINDLDSKQRVVLQTIAGDAANFKTPVLPPSRYAYWVRATGPNGVSVWSQPGIFTVLAAAPQDVVVTADDARKVNIAWAAVPNATDYELWISRKGSSTPYLQRAQIGAVTSWELSAVPGDEYTVWVRALRPGRVHSSWSGAKTVLVRQAPAVTLALPDVRWSAIGQATGYDMVIANVRTGATVANQTVTSGNTFKVVPPPGPGVYEVTMRSRYSDGTTSLWTTARQELFHPAVMILEQGVSTIDATPTLHWIAQAGATGYEMVVIRSGSTRADYTASDLVGTNHRIATALPNGEHQIWVRAHHANGTRSAWGSGSRIFIGAAPVLTLADRGVKWTAATGATRYEVSIYKFDPTSSTFSKLLQTGVLGGTTFTLPTSTKGQFRVWVRAIRDEAGSQYASWWSNAVNFTV